MRFEGASFGGSHRWFGIAVDFDRLHGNLLSDHEGLTVEWLEQVLLANQPHLGPCVHACAIPVPAGAAVGRTERSRHHSHMHAHTDGPGHGVESVYGMRVRNLAARRVHAARKSECHVNLAVVLLRARVTAEFKLDI